MKAISVRPPWSWAIINAGKRFENRTWRTSYTGPVLIHASKTFDRAGYLWLKEHRALFAAELPEPEAIERCGIIGKVNITGTVDHAESPWFFGPVGWVLEDALSLPFVPMKGRLGLFDCDPDVLVINN